jgi:FKBP-type peptidyl-prolyl cis-trans isomerase 2
MCAAVHATLAVRAPVKPSNLTSRFAVAADARVSRRAPISSFSRHGRRGALRAVAAIEDNQVVTIHYVLKFASGEVADDTRKRNAPVRLPIGQGALFPTLEAGIKEMGEGEKRVFNLACKDAYGERDEGKIQKFPASAEELESVKAQVQPGRVVQLPNGGTAVCVGFEDDGLILDLNHPMAGKDLEFEIELVEVEEGPKLFGVPVVPFDVNKLVMK